MQTHTQAEQMQAGCSDYILLSPVGGLFEGENIDYPHQRQMQKARVLPRNVFAAMLESDMAYLVVLSNFFFTESIIREVKKLDLLITNDS